MAYITFIQAHQRRTGQRDQAEAVRKFGRGDGQQASLERRPLAKAISHDLHLNISGRCG